MPLSIYYLYITVQTFILCCIVHASYYSTLDIHFTRLFIPNRQYMLHVIEKSKLK